MPIKHYNSIAETPAKQFAVLVKRLPLHEDPALASPERKQVTEYSGFSDPAFPEADVTATVPLCAGRL